MSEDEFWNLIDQTKGDDPRLVGANLRRALESLSDDDLADFHEYFQDALGGAYTNAVWGAGYLANGGMSDDAFEYFRTWLVMQGLETYVSVVADPDSLADVPASFGYQLEGPQYLSRELYADRTGTQPPRPGSKVGDLGPDWDFDDQAEMAKRYPRIAAKVLKNPPLPPGFGFEAGNSVDPSPHLGGSGGTSAGSGSGPADVAGREREQQEPTQRGGKRPWWKFWA